MQSENQQVYFDQLSGPAEFVAKLIVEELYRLGVNTYAVSPGARSIPMIEAIKEHSKTDLRIFNDERQAGFWAQANSKAKGQATVLLVTSGTAVANLLPAVMEAYHSRVPLIVISCDRPWELQKSTANQTVKQEGIFHSFVRDEISLPAIDNSFPPGALLSNIDSLVSKSHGAISGPVHLNLAFRKPYQLDCFELKHFLEPEDQELFKRWYSSKQRFRQFSKQITGTSISELELLSKTIDAAKNPLIVCGPLNKAVDQLAVSALAEQLNVQIFADIDSGLRGKAEALSLYNLYLQKLNPSDYDLLVYVGDRIISEPLREFITKLPCVKFLLNNHDSRQDGVENEFIYFNYHYFVDISKYLAAVSYKLNSQAKQTVNLSQLESQAQKSILDNPSFVEGRVVAEIVDMLPEDTILYHSSSLILRELEFFAKPKSSLSIVSNRGCVGIDGVLASAIGYAEGKNKKTVLIIGDQALRYDLTSLSLLPEQNFAVVVINNNGGAVFKMLASDVEDELVNTGAGDFKNLTTSFGADYHCISESSECQNLSRMLVSDFASCVIEMKCDGSESVEFFKNFRFED